MTEPEQTRARYPDETGFVERGGVRTFYEVYGEDGPTVLLLPPWTIFHSRIWKGQIPYLARHFRVVCFDGRGGGRSDAPSADPGDYSTREICADALAVMDATRTERAVMVGFSRATQYTLWLATEHPERCLAMAAITPSGFPASMRSLGTRLLFTGRLRPLTRRSLPGYPGMLKFHPRFMTERYPEFLRWFATTATGDAHSTKVCEDAVTYAHDAGGAVAVATLTAPGVWTRRALIERAAAVRCPTLVMHGTSDPLCPNADAKLLARHTGGELISMPGRGHSINGRYPVFINNTLRRFIEEHAHHG